MRVADTSALYAAVVAKDAHHAKARLALAEPEPILVPAEVWAQTLELLSYRAGPDLSRAAAHTFLQLPHLEIQPTWDEPWDNLQRVALEKYDEGNNPSYVDCVVIGWCKKRKLAPWTYDEKLAAACNT